MYIAINKEWLYEWHSNQKISVHGWMTIKLNNKSELIKLQNWCKYENGEIVISPEYLEKIEKKEKDLAIKNLKELSNKSIKNLALFDATERMYEPSELKTHELNLLEHRGQELLEEINIAKSEAIEKYGIEILEELL